MANGGGVWPTVETQLAMDFLRNTGTDPLEKGKGFNWFSSGGGGGGCAALCDIR